MQYKNSEFNPDEHDRYPALTVKQPYADNLVTFDQEIDGVKYAVKRIEVRSKKTKFRGDLLITSSADPVLPGLESGVTLGFVELYDVKPAKDFTPEEWEQTSIPEPERNKYRNGYGWYMRNPRRVIEFPIMGQVGIWNLVYTKNVIMEYPTAVKVDKESFKLLNKKSNEKGKKSRR